MGIRKKIKKRLPIFGRRKPENSVSVQETKAADTPSWMAPEPEPETPRGDMEAQAYIEQTIKDNKIVLFMKGSPMQPQCGFSANAAGILASYGVQFTHVDVILDYDVREAIKDFSQWPTLPQIYIDGEFVGGSDILSEMHQDGSLREMVT